MTEPAAVQPPNASRGNLVTIVLLEEILEQVLHTRRTQTEHTARLHAIQKELQTMATQDQIDAIAAQLDAFGGSLSAALAGIQSDLDALKAANPALDLSGLQAKVDALGAVVQQASDIDAENP